MAQKISAVLFSEGKIAPVWPVYHARGGGGEVGGLGGKTPPLLTFDIVPSSDRVSGHFFS